jgi:hypothetical protein
MPTFEDMKKIYSSNVIGEQIKEMSNMVMNETFSNTTTYRNGMIYDCNMNEIQNMEFKFIKTKTYTIEKDQVEYWVQFRPGVNPEINFDTSKDQKHRFGYYIDILDDNTKLYEKWLIVGKDVSEFDRYNVLKCNWLFEWLDENRVYRKCLGCVRDRNSYNSGVWSDGFTTSVENQTAFIVPTNDITMAIDYGKRFMITDNTIYPKTYEVTKMMDTFPLGVTKVVLKQCHYNEHIDLCGIDEEFFGDEDIHMICNYFESGIKPSPNKLISSISWTLSDVNEKLYVHGQPQVIKAIPNEYMETFETCEWHIFIDDEDYTNKLEELVDYLDLSLDPTTNTLTIAAINKDLANYIISIKIYDSARTYYDFVEMEVCI